MSSKPTIGEAASTDMGPGPPPSAAGAPPPDWSAIPFEVPCTRCGQSLREAVEPRCSGCGAQFDWDEVLPLEDLRCLDCDYRLLGVGGDRCPECGSEYDWNTVLPAARSRRNRLFERWWYHNPVPSLLRTWFLAAWRPRAVWQQCSVHDKPSVVPLLMFMLIQWAVFLFGWPAVAVVADSAMNGTTQWLQDRGWCGWIQGFTYGFRPQRGFVPFVGFWYLGTLLSMQIFVQSNARYGIGWRHGLRILVHATAFASLAMGLWCVLEMLADAILFFTPAAGRILTRRLYERIGEGVFLLGLIVTWAHLWIGYRRHLRMPHGWGMAAAALLLGNLLARLAKIYDLTTIRPPNLPFLPFN
ncbi:MAG: hypothetical protein GY778_22715 [bacterium]|nr:hypothetical protein [bacterium]